MSRLKERYQSQIRSELQKKFSFANPMQIPMLQKVVINMGIAEASKDKNSIQDCVNELTLLSGQKPIITRAKKAISNFKLREGQAIGVKVTLRGLRMYEFLVVVSHPLNLQVILNLLRFCLTYQVPM